MFKDMFISFFTQKFVSKIFQLANRRIQFKCVTWFYFQNLLLIFEEKKPASQMQFAIRQLFTVKKIIISKPPKPLNPRDNS